MILFDVKWHNMKKTNLLIIVLSIFFISSCIKEDFFGLSPYGNIKSIEVSNQAKQAVIDNQTKTVEIEIPPGVDLNNIVLQELSLSSFATADKSEGDPLPLSEPAPINITAEDGSLHTWTIKGVVATSNPQLDNSDFNQWYQMPSGYYEPGENAETTIWATGNPGSYTLKIIAVTPLEMTDENRAVNMQTMDNGPLAGMFGAPISAGSIFTGKFNTENIDPSNPAAAIDFGTPFAGRPQKFKLKYKYKPGPENKDKKGNVLPFDDSCDIYALLEVKSAGEIKRLATAWFRSSETKEEMTEMEAEFTYGPLDNSFPDYMKPKNHGFVDDGSQEFILPTHITFVATSSFDGDNFAGAIGSELIIDDLEFIYEK
ncbi:hypothetical protein DMA11_13040 [Marinilabiliaceae bacterium JC017]|nr:hypothetical protein DMA11_13040 [Marinilabiliaceae bacterium JC017]